MHHSATGLKLSRAFFTGSGLLCVGLGVVGAFVPLMPSTVFLIVAAWCLARGNPRLYRRLRRHRAFAPVRDWQLGRGLSAAAKLAALGSITVTFSLTIVFVIEHPLVKFLLLSFALGLSIYLLLQPTRRPLNQN